MFSSWSNLADFLMLISEGHTRATYYVPRITVYYARKSRAKPFSQNSEIVK